MWPLKSPHLSPVEHIWDVRATINKYGPNSLKNVSCTLLNQRHDESKQTILIYLNLWPRLCSDTDILKKSLF